MKPYSLLRRITVSLSVTMLIASLCAFGWLYVKARDADIDLREHTLLDQARVIAGYLQVDSDKSITLVLPARLAEAYSYADSRYRYAIRDANLNLLYDAGDNTAPLPDLDTGGFRLYDYDPDGAGPLRVFGAALRTAVGSNIVYVQVEERAHEPNYLRKAVLDEFLADGGWLEIIFLFIVLGLSILIIKRAVLPLERISRLAETIGPSSANVRLPTDSVPSEVLPLVRSMNAALDRLDHGLARQREFNADAAHQLRTPLAVLLANVDTLSEADTARRLRIDVEHMSRIVSQLLLVARLETFSVALDERLDLNEAAAEIAASFAPLAIATGKTVALQRTDRPIVVRTSAFALREALGNLIENAIRHTRPNTSVQILLTPLPSIEVMDSGPGIPLAQRSQIFDRFWRGDRTIGGAGLGLAIVQRIMTALGGSVSVSDAPGGGARFCLIFAAAAVRTEAHTADAEMSR